MDSRGVLNLGPFLNPLGPFFKQRLGSWHSGTISETCPLGPVDFWRGQC